MSQEMSFAQALTEAKQIIVQQSNRIKADLDRIKAVQETVTAQTATITDQERTLRQKTAELDAATEQMKVQLGKFDEMKLAKEQGEAVIDRQGQRLTQMQETIAGLEKQLTETTSKFEEVKAELAGIRSQVPTQEDTDALAALTALLSAKKGAPAPVKPVEEALAA